MSRIRGGKVLYDILLCIDRPLSFFKDIINNTAFKYLQNSDGFILFCNAIPGAEGKF